MGDASLIVLLTDFGTEHWYGAAMKGEILSRASHAVILDLSHDVPRQSIESGAFILQSAIDSFPRRTIFCCVVDPGVGSDRRTLVGWAGKYGFVGPDNGLITPLLDRAGDQIELHEIKSPTFRNPEVSATFHGRDIFAPAAARLLLGDDPRMAGPRVTDPVRLPRVVAVEDGVKINGKVMLIDHFGNAITNIERSTFGERLRRGPFDLQIESLHLTRVNTCYAAGESNEPLCYWGSSGTLEIAVNYGSAADSYGIEVGTAATIALGD